LQLLVLVLFRLLSARFKSSNALRFRIIRHLANTLRPNGGAQFHARAGVARWLGCYFAGKMIELMVLRGDIFGLRHPHPRPFFDVPRDGRGRYTTS
jgi:hypothetical protein